jgi:hypothetical protein
MQVVHASCPMQVIHASYLCKFASYPCKLSNASWPMQVIHASFPMQVVQCKLSNASCPAQTDDLDASATYDVASVAGVLNTKRKEVEEIQFELSCLGNNRPFPPTAAPQPPFRARAHVRLHQPVACSRETETEVAARVTPTISTT